jgi:3-dehydroquinate dehydratase-2
LGNDALQILVLHGPNLNLLGVREPDVYGARSLAQIDDGLSVLGQTLKANVRCLQSNHEGVLVDSIQAAMGHVDGILINPAALTHTSVALRDSLLASQIPFVEVHLSNIYGREEFRRMSLLADVAIGTVSGFGHLSYELGLRALVDHVQGDDH